MATPVTVYNPALPDYAHNGSLGNYRLKLTISQVSQSIANNTSVVRGQVWLESDSYSSFYGVSSLHQEWINGTSVYNGYVSRDIGTSSSVLVLNNTLTVAHNSDGTKTVSVSALFNNDYTGTHTISGSLVLDTIPRATTPTWTGNFKANAASSYSTVISLPRADASFTHDVSYVFGSASGTIATGAGTSATWTPAATLCSQIPNATSGTGTLTVVTKSGATTIGTKTASFTLEADTDIIPSISSVAWTDTNTTVATNIGAFVQNVSTVKGVLTSAGIYGSTITSETVTTNGTTANENVAILQTGSGTITASGTCIDSRGRSKTLANNFTVLAYTVPTINSWQVRRCDSGGTVSDTGTYLRLDLNAVVSSLIVSSTEKNAMTIQVRTRPTGGSWTSRNTITPGLTYNTNVLVSGGGIYAIAASYEVEVTVADKTGVAAATILASIPTSTVTLDLNGANVGIGKYHTQGALDVNGAIYGTNIYSNSTQVSVIGHTHATSDVTSGTFDVARIPNLENLNGTLDVASGGTGAATALAARQNLGVGIVQSKITTVQTSFSTASTTYVDVTGVTVTITPTSTSNTILVRVLGYSAHNNTSYPPTFRVLRGSTVVPTTLTNLGVPYNGSDTSGGSSFCYEFMDSPATTSATTYKLQVVSGNAAGTVYVGRYVASDTKSLTSISVTEIQV